MNWRSGLLIAAAMVLLGLGLGIFATTCYGNHTVTTGLVKAQQDHVAATVATAQADDDQKASAAQEVTRLSDEQDVDAKQEAVQKAKKRLEASETTPAAANTPQSPTPDLVDNLKATVTAQEALIASMGKDLQDTKAELATEKIQVDHLRTALNARTDEVAQLHLTITALQAKVRPNSVGAYYGTDKTIGVSYDHDFGPVRGGVTAIRVPLGNGQSSTQVLAHVSYSF